MTAPVRVAVLKPDLGGVGGFERLLRRAEVALRDAGFQVDVVTFDAHTRATELHGIPLGGIRDAHDEYFAHLAAVERMDRLDLADHDVVVATQPPTQLVRHPAVVALTYHQARVFYDLADDFTASGFVDPEFHAAAIEEVRALDRARIGSVHTWVAGSDEVAERLRTFWDVEDVVPLRARAETPPVDDALDAFDPTGPAVCVSRHEWPKRTELAVQVAATGDTPVELVGGGSRLAWIRALADRYESEPGRAGTDGPAETWRTTGPRLLDADSPAAEGSDPMLGGRLRIHGEVDDATRNDAYRRAGVVLAPAYREDYGLTVLEAFAHGRPVVVCSDGGGLVELVADTGAGLVVDPDPATIADAVDALRRDPDRARTMAAAAHAIALADRDRDDLAPLVAAVRSAAGR